MFHRFVSALGPDQAPSDLDVRYLEATGPDFGKALKAKADLDPGLFASGYTTVIYRLVYDSPNDEFYWSRQINLSLGDSEGKPGGNEKGPDEPAGLDTWSYELLSVPVSVLSSGKELELANQVRQIFKRSNSSKPGHGYP